jgi:DtxR family Mn-dependent transcriptional regulator
MTRQRASGPALSESEENYIKAIYRLQSDSPGGRVSTTALADRLGIAPASVTGMVQKLAAGSPTLVDYIPRQGVALTPRGERVALEVIRHHRLIELYLYQELGYPWDEVHAEAERLEHVISEEFEDRVAALLGDPAVDPHGQPIPRKDGSCPEPAGVALATLGEGLTVEVVRVSDDDPDLLRYLGALGIMPGARLTLLARGPFGGPLTVRIGGGAHGVDGNADADTHALGSPVTENVFVV